uniref:Uncharacterized protein n=1 Tax=Strombidium inclinatum TaxID=197538 RepID=A0A7S3IHR2_9SPIT|mmetsp:Transcript_19688/g.30407  ORF Transcript_19688/g.30407 Transcript_19688/m.30407 type:complete len:127 (+) Transcript_19688:190-570(+)
MQKIFGRKRKKVSEEQPLLDVKGNKIHYGSQLEVSQGGIERHLFEIDKGPRMLPRKTRFKVWTALIGIGSWFAFCFFIISFRLKSDDLELMEREVYEELAKKKEVEQFIKKSKEEDGVFKMEKPSE